MRLSRWVIHESVLRTVNMASPGTVLHAHAQAYTQTLDILIIVCWNEQVSSPVLAFPSEWEQQCSDDSFRQNSPIPPHQKVSQKVPSRGWEETKKQEGSVCTRVNEISGFVVGHWRTELCSPYQYHSGCGAHHPASTTATPEIKIMSGLKLWLHPTESPGEQDACHVFPSQWLFYFAKSFRPSRTRVELLTYIFSIGVDDSLQPLTPRIKRKIIVNQPSCGADSSAASAAARCSSRRYPLTG